MLLLDRGRAKVLVVVLLGRVVVDVACAAPAVGCAAVVAGHCYATLANPAKYAPEVVVRSLVALIGQVKRKTKKKEMIGPTFDMFAQRLRHAFNKTFPRYVITGRRGAVLLSRNANPREGPRDLPLTYRSRLHLLAVLLRATVFKNV